jgi:hypothetical protein
LLHVLEHLLEFGGAQSMLLVHQPQGLAHDLSVRGVLRIFCRESV